ncbi:MAG: glycogen debranching protein [Kiritimatiellaeota bacterium]|nr:glycogen debranching protein [Kiritimatiellota bacterium]
MNLALSRQDCRDRAGLASREWLDVNGTGGYASGTVLGPPTRKYHGLLVANLPAPAAGRHVLVTVLEETVELGGVNSSLSAVEFESSSGSAPVLPEHFAAFPVPTWTYRLPGVRVERSVLMLHRRDTVLIRYRFDAAGTALGRLVLGPLLAFRRNHDLARRNPYLNDHAELRADGFCLEPYTGMPPLHFQIAGPRSAQFAPGPEWRQGVFYRVEQERGYPAREDLFRPGVLTVEFGAGDTILAVLSTEPVDDPAAELAEELERRRARHAAARETALRYARNEAEEVLGTALCLSAQTFLVRVPPDRPTVPAGYHWFEDWGRDTLISLPGLVFVSGRLRAGLEVMQTFVDHEKDGRIPNYIGPDGDGAYNSVDAPLWLFWTLQQYLLYGGELRELRRFMPVLKRLLERLAAGSTGDGVYLDRSGLLHSGTPETQLTWMDAVVDGRPVTPRCGFAVEICALWYNALRFACDLAAALGESDYTPPVAPARVAVAFRERFRLPDRAYLADVVGEERQDGSLRPNQILAVSLPHSPLDAREGRGVVDAVRGALLTPRGLRTLAPDAPAYRGRYGGPVRERDFAYHQGTVWPWLLGHFGEAFLKTYGWRHEARQNLRDHLNGWLPHLFEAGVGSVSEVFDGDPPHRPDGCISQAWSVAELIRLFSLIEEGPLQCEF